MDDHYSSEEEEVYFGSFAKSEITRRKHIFGDHYTSTPEQIRHLPASLDFSRKRTKECLPDVINGANCSSSGETVLGGLNSSTGEAVLSGLNSSTGQDVLRGTNSSYAQDDVLSGSSSSTSQKVLSRVANSHTPQTRQNEQSEGVIKNKTVEEEHQNEDSLLDESDDVIIINASTNSNTIITLSDDESFAKHENSFSNTSARSDDSNEYEHKGKKSASIINISSQDEKAEDLSDESIYSSQNYSYSKSEETNSKTSSNIPGNHTGLNENTLFSSKYADDTRTGVEPCQRNSFSVKDSAYAFDDGGEFVVKKSDSINISSQEDKAEAIQLSDESTSKNHSCSTEGAANNEITTTMSSNQTGLSENSSCESLNDNGTALCVEAQQNNSFSIRDSKSAIVDYLHDSDAYNFGDKSCVDDISTYSFNEISRPNTTSEPNFDPSKNSSLILDIDDFVSEKSATGKSSALLQCTDNDCESKKNIPERLNCSSSIEEVDCQEKSSCVITNSLPKREPCKLKKDISFEQDKTLEDKQDKTFDTSGLISYEFSLNGVSDSILNISRGSSLPSPPKISRSSDLVTYQNSCLYEDISCDGNQLDNDTEPNARMADEDLHMSVDEVDFRQNECSGNLADFTNTSQPSDYISCPPSAHSSYNTASGQTYGGDQSTSERSNSFQNYRDPSELDIGDEDFAVTFKSNQENGNEAGFEIIAQNRQNSFIRTPISETSTDKDEAEKSKPSTKLPVFQGTKSLLRPPKLYVKPDSLKTSSYKFAEQINQVCKMTSNISRPASAKTPKPLSKPISSPRNISKLPSPKIPASSSKKVNSPTVRDMKTQAESGKQCTKTPVKTSSSNLNNPYAKTNIPTPKPSSSLTKSKIPSHSYLSVTKTPAKNVNTKTSSNIVHSTPAQNMSAIPRAVKSETKTKRVMTPSKQFNSSLQSTEKNSHLKNKYKNIVSPIQTYIRGSPSVAQRKAHATDEHIFEKPMNKPLHVTPVKSPSAAMQKLKFNNVPEQENVNPNVIDLSRDTIPSKMFEPSQEVFWKHEPAKSRLPKMGEKQTKILTGSPKVTVTRHEGRVNECPKAKGVLVPNNLVALSPSVADSSLPTLEQGDARISVRIQKTVQLQ